jgi:hypothetical protein
MKYSALDYYTLLLLLIQVVIILYATRILPSICKPLRRAWRFFILGLVGMFFSRVFFSMDCFNVYQTDVFVELLLTVNSGLMFYFVRLVARGLHKDGHLRL